MSAEIELKVWLTDSVSMDFCWVSMGEPSGNAANSDSSAIYDSASQLNTTTSEGFWIGKFPVTQRQWQAVMNNNPSFFRGTLELPVDSMSYVEAKKFIQVLNARDMNFAYSIPTKSEWECAGRDLLDLCAKTDMSSLYKHAWTYGNSYSGTTAVGQKEPNRWNLYDLLGNVWEWVDAVGDDAKKDVTEYPVLVGGSFQKAQWRTIPPRLMLIEDSDADVGFRVVVRRLNGLESLLRRISAKLRSLGETFGLLPSSVNSDSNSSRKGIVIASETEKVAPDVRVVVATWASSGTWDEIEEQIILEGNTSESPFLFHRSFCKTWRQWCDEDCRPEDDEIEYSESLGIEEDEDESEDVDLVDSEDGDHEPCFHEEEAEQLTFWTEKILSGGDLRRALRGLAREVGIKNIDLPEMESMIEEQIPKSWIKEFRQAKYEMAEEASNDG